MKNLIILIGIILFAVSVESQAQDIYIGPENNHASLDGAAGDTASSASESIIKSAYLGGKDKVQLYTVTIGLDSISGTTAITTTLQSSHDAGVTWVDISSQDFSMTQSDTAIHFQDLSTGTDAPRLRTKTDGAASTKVKLDYLYFRVTDKN